ncbi:MAG: histidine phosphatase family protein [Desulfovibrio sp.]
MNIALIRHAQAYKNIENKHGGPGTHLTPYGVKQAKKCFAELPCVKGFKRVYSTKSLQCIKTMNLFKSVSTATQVVLDREYRFNLGVLDGLSEEDCRIQYPEVASNVEAWRRQELEICDLNIPNATCSSDFYKRSEKLLEKVTKSGEDVVLFGTRSVLICLTNILLGRTPEKGGNYREIIWSNCGWVLFEALEDKNVLVESSGVGIWKI